VTWPIRETLEHIEPHLFRQLIPRCVLSHIKTIADLLPDVLASGCYLECRLAADLFQVDLLTGATIYDGGREILAGQDAEADLPAVLLSNPLWKRIRNFFIHWADPVSPLYSQIPFIGLEFDHVDRPPPKIPLPGFSFCLDPEYLKRHTRAADSKALDAQTYQAVTEVACETLLGHLPPTPDKTKPLDLL